VETGHRFIVDHIEGDLVVVQVEGGPVLDLPLMMMPAGVKSGDVIVGSVLHQSADAVTLRLTIDRDASASRAAEAIARVERLRRMDPGGDIRI